MGFYNKFLDFIGIEETDDKNDPDNDIFDSREEPVRSRSQQKAPARREQRSQGSIEPAAVPNMASMKMIVYHPVSYEDAQSIIDNLKARKPVIVNMEELEVSGAQRILDFLSGAVYAINGTICKISRGIFVVTPNNYDVVGNDEDEYIEM